MKVIAHIKSDFKTKFGIPRQSGLARNISIIVFESEYRCDEALRGIEQYSHLWLLWEFSEVKDKPWSPTVRPPRLGGNKRVGVFATRSPFRPNNIGLSCVKLIEVKKTAEGMVLIVSGADLMDGTPIYDIKPYIPYADCHPDAVGGFAEEKKEYILQVECENTLLSLISEDKRDVLLQILSQDPRPQYIDDPQRIYGFEFADAEVKFSVSENTLFVKSIEKLNSKNEY